MISSFLLDFKIWVNSKINCFFFYTHLTASLHHCARGFRAGEHVVFSKRIIFSIFKNVLKLLLSKLSNNVVLLLFEKIFMLDLIQK
jgi:hypothetical protein